MRLRLELESYTEEDPIQFTFFIARVKSAVTQDIINVVTGDLNTLSNNTHFYYTTSPATPSVPVSVALNPLVFKTIVKRSCTLGIKTLGGISDPMGQVRKVYNMVFKKLGYYDNPYGANWNNTRTYGMGGTKNLFLLIFCNDVSTDSQRTSIKITQWAKTITD